MALKNQKQQGFSAVATLVILIIIVGIAFGGWYVWHQNSDDTVMNTVQETVDNESLLKDSQAEEEWVEYKNQSARIKFEYPESWKNTPNEPQVFDDGQLGEVSGILTSPSENVLEWHYTIWGGKGGDCEPAPIDVPFASSNNCSSKHIYSVDILPELSAKDNPLLGPSKRLVLTKTKYRSNTAEPVSYQICLDDFYREDSPPEAGTRMGLLFQCEYWTTGFNMKFKLPNEAAFNSEEAKIAEQIMRSVDIF